jgi:hypothetical protein
LGVTSHLYIASSMKKRLTCETFVSLLNELVARKVVLRESRCLSGAVSGGDPSLLFDGKLDRDTNQLYRGNSPQDLFKEICEAYQESDIAVVFQCLDPCGPDICSWPDGVECWVGVFSLQESISPRELEPLDKVELLASGFSEEEIADIERNHEGAEILPTCFYLHLSGKRAPIDDLDAVDSSSLKAIISNFVGDVQIATAVD